MGSYQRAMRFAASPQRGRRSETRAPGSFLEWRCMHVAPAWRFLRGWMHTGEPAMHDATPIRTLGLAALVMAAPLLAANAPMTERMTLPRTD